MAEADLETHEIDAPADEDHAGDPAIEARAREMGWKPLAEYRGPPGKWQPAADFIDRGENILPIVRDQNRRLAERVGKLESEIGGLRTTAQEQLQIIKDLRDMGRSADQRGYERAMAELKSRQRRAVEAGDTTAYDQLVEQAEALASARPPAPEVKKAPDAPPPPQPPQLSQAVRDFVAQNPWFNRDAFLTRKMIDRHIDVIQEGAIVDEAEQLETAKQELMADYPDRFGGAPPAPRPRVVQTPRRAAAVAAPTVRQAAPVPGAPLVKIDQIQDVSERQQARDAFNRTKRQLPDYTEAEYMALYADPHADVLTMQKPRK
jgi:uncharacterized protein (UPF0335 family)